MVSGSTTTFAAYKPLATINNCIRFAMTFLQTAGIYNT